MTAKATISALRGETPPPKPRNLYAGKTYNSSEAIAEFFKKKSATKSQQSEPPASAGGIQRDLERPSQNPSPSALDKLRAAGSQGNPQSAIHDPQSLVAGSHVRHEKYGRGLVLRREGSGDNVKLTVSFPGFGQKKLIEKFANLQRDS